MDQGELSYIKVPYPNAKDLQLKIVVPTCLLVISPGIGNAWVTGKYNDSKDVAPLSITQSGNVAQIIAMGAFAYRTPRKYLPDMKLSFGRLHPFSLSIKAGDLNDRLDFGGIPLSSMEIQYGGGSQIIDFSYPNPQLMSRMKVEADNGKVQIENIANANVLEIQVRGDSTKYRLNFGGELVQKTNLNIGIGVSSVEVSLPSSTAIKIKSGTQPTCSQTDDIFYLDKEFWNSAAREKQEEQLYIHNTASSSSIRLKYI
jgi:hypothetical protein